MKLLTFKKDNEVRLGVKTDNGILDLNKAGLDFTLEDLVKNENGLSLVKEIINSTDSENHLSEAEIEFLPPLLNPEKIICVGLNYQSHVEEAKLVNVPENPVLFSKFNNALAAHSENIPLPKVGGKFDFEAELVMVIGKEAKDVSEEEALSYVFGYTAGNDLSVRDLQFLTGQWLIGKSPDGFAPIGPYVVPAEEVDPFNLNIECKVNSEVRQSSNTKHMIFNCAKIVSYISKHMTLRPGDLVFTGTPEGVILGLPENEQVWLKPGDEMEVTIENIGTLRNFLV
ncbi:fumarylacetoacetate hydrolase family protein [Neobacillus citreus]|uniref:Fumarylacetoacetate hydrolase family protein n=1 Tax=Neobacillus citreus TaxID=2833578 RepID=A0A942Y5M0_9BACI|nr:fumarylacetoacetate hydrolase family protein [Neobacillus citreus]MCH6266338.1 fumarylacetoacetate hydrolase family protein [Neobacillus citreus]